MLYSGLWGLLLRQVRAFAVDLLELRPYDSSDLGGCEVMRAVPGTMARSGLADCTPSEMRLPIC